MMFTKEELRILWPFYCAQLVAALFALLGAYQIIYFVENGLSLFQVSVLLAVTVFVSLLFDIPTGAVADLYGPKVSVLISYFSIGVISLLVPLSSNFYYLLVMFTLWGIAQTFRSGAYEAWVVTTLKQRRKEHLLERVFAHTMVLNNVGTVVSPLLAALLVKRYDLSLLWILDGVGMVLAALILLNAKEHFKRKSPDLRNSFSRTWSQSKKAIGYGTSHPVLFDLIIASTFLILSLSFIGLLWQPYLKEFSLPIEYYGYILSIAGALSIGVPILTYKLSARFSKTTAYLTLLALLFLALLVSVLFISSTMLAAGVIIFLYVAIMFYAPVEGAFFQRHVPGRMRATLGSFKSTVEAFGGGVAILIVGLLADRAGPKHTLALAGVFLIPTIYLYWRLGRKDPVDQKPVAS